MGVLRRGFRRLMTACLPADLWLTRGRRRQNLPEPAVSLTFDDGPHPEYTPQALERLRRYGWKGTFFLVGERAAAHPDLVRRIIEDGHEVGNHSYTHSEPAETSVGKLLDEVRATRRLLEEIAGKPVTLMRPPRGNVTVSKLIGLWREQQTIVLWSVDPKDYRLGRDAELEALDSRLHSASRRHRAVPRQPPAHRRHPRCALAKSTPARRANGRPVGVAELNTGPRRKF